MSERRRILLFVLFILVLFNISRYTKPAYKLRAGRIGDPVVVSAPEKYFHEPGYQNAWIQFVDNGLVQVQIVGSKLAIVFRPESSDLELFQVGRIAPVTFECSTGYNEKCDLA